MQGAKCDHHRMCSQGGDMPLAHSPFGEIPFVHDHFFRRIETIVPLRIRFTREHGWTGHLLVRFSQLSHFSYRSFVTAVVLQKKGGTRSLNSFAKSFTAD